MARIRTVKPEFWSHPVMGKIDDSSKCLALALLNFADDEGYFLADPNLVRSSCRPFDDDSTTIRRCLDVLSKAEWIEVKTHPTHGPIGLVVNFVDHQKIDRPKPSSISTYFLDVDSTIDRRLIAVGMEGNGMEGKGRERAPKVPAWASKHGDDVVETTQRIYSIWPNKSRRQPNGEPVPVSHSPILADRLTAIKAEGGSLTICVAIAERFLDEYEKGGWLKAAENFFGIGTKEKPAPWKSYYKAHLTNEGVDDVA